MGVDIIKKCLNLVISKSQNKVGVAEEIGCENDIGLRKIVAQKPVHGWMDGWMEVKAVLRIVYSNKI